MSGYRILYTNGTTYIGGAEVSLLNLLKRLNGGSFIPIAAIPSKEGPFAEKLRAMGIDIRAISLMEFSRYKCFSFLAAVFRLVSLIKKEGVDLVHANSIYTAEQSFFAAKLAGVPCICHVRDLVPILGAGKARSFVFRHMNRLIAISNAVKTDLTEKLNIPERNIARIYNGVDARKFSPGVSGEAFRREFGLGSKKLIGIIGRLSPEKGHESFLKATARLISDRDDIRIVIVGSSDLGPKDYREKLESLAAHLGVGDKVYFTGFRDDLPRIMAALDVVAVPSAAEPFGRVIIEAMAMEKPVVAFNTGAAPEILSRDCGIIIGPQDSKGFIEAIFGLLADAARRKRLGSEGRRIVLEKFSIEKNTLEIEGLYKKLLGRHAEIH